MKKEDVKVGMRVKINASWFTGAGVVTDLDHDYFPEAVWVKCDGGTEDRWISARYIEPAEQPFPLANTKINVQKYAEENGISLEQAHQEIQPWLFEQGYSWCKEVHVRFTNSSHLYAEEDSVLAYGHNDQFFSADDGKEITLSRKVTVELTPSFVEVEEPAVEYVELGGKRYVKSELEEALSKIKAVEE